MHEARVLTEGCLWEDEIGNGIPDVPVSLRFGTRTAGLEAPEAVVKNRYAVPRDVSLTGIPTVSMKPECSPEVLMYRMCP